MTTEFYFSIIGAITGITGAALGILGIFHNRYIAIHQYLEAIDKSDFTEVRSRIYNSTPDQLAAYTNKDVPLLVNFFHHWGLLTKKHYLPLWVFDYGSGSGVIRLYELTQNYIMARRELHQDNTYASGFEWLYYKMLRRKERKHW